MQRYVEIDSQLKRVMTVVKSRSRPHSSDIRLYEIDIRGIVVGERLENLDGIISGLPQRRSATPTIQPRLTDQEASVLTALVGLRQADESDLTQRTGLQPAVCAWALKRLEDLGYVDKILEDNRAMYRPRESG